MVLATSTEMLTTEVIWLLDSRSLLLVVTPLLIYVSYDLGEAAD
jgi:hypothetical protein